MRKTVLFLIVVLCVAAVAGCGRAAADSGFRGEDLHLTVEGTAYGCNTNIEEVIDHLGSGYTYAEGQSCDYDGLDKSFLYEEVAFYTNPLAEGDMINEIYTTSPTVSTSRGMAVGASREDVLSAYGEAAEAEEDILIYRLPDDRVSLCFELEDGVVWAIYLTTQSV